MCVCVRACKSVCALRGDLPLRLYHHHTATGAEENASQDPQPTTHTHSEQESQEVPLNVMSILSKIITPITHFLRNDPTAPIPGI